MGLPGQRIADQPVATLSLAVYLLLLSGIATEIDAHGAGSRGTNRPGLFDGREIGVHNGARSVTRR